MPLNNWLVIQPHDGIDPDALFAALSEPDLHRWLKSDSRRYGDGLWKLEPSELKRVRLTRDREALYRRRS